MKRLVAAVLMASSWLLTGGVALWVNQSAEVPSLDGKLVQDALRESPLHKEMRRLFEENCEQLPAEEAVRWALWERQWRAQQSSSEAFKQALEDAEFQERFGFPDPFLAFVN